jgi:hypothetical protein
MGSGSETDCACAPKTDNSRQIARGRCFIGSKGVAFAPELGDSWRETGAKEGKGDFLSFSQMVFQKHIITSARVAK